MHIIDLFKALSDHTRLRVMRLLLMNQVEIGVGKFVEVLQGKPYNVSKQLKVLEHCGLVQIRKEGRNVYYRLADNEVGILENIYQLISGLPDAEGDFEEDQLRFEHQAEKRTTSAGSVREPVTEHEKEKRVAQEGMVAQEQLPSHLL